MTRRETDSGNNSRKLTGVYANELAAIMSQSAVACGFSLKRVVEAGGTYPLEKGGSSVVGEGRVYIEMTLAKPADFVLFWAKAKEFGYEEQYQKLYKTS